MFWWLFIGLVAGAIAGQLVRDRSFGCLGNIIVGSIGGFVGGWLFNLLNVSVGGGLLGSLITSTIGAVAFLVVLNLVFGRD